MKKKSLAAVLSAAMVMGTIVSAATPMTVMADDPEEITWMFWDDLEATQDLISLGYADVIDRFNTTYEGQYHCTPITTNLEEYDGKVHELNAAGRTPDRWLGNPGANMGAYEKAGVAADMTGIR